MKRIRRRFSERVVSLFSPETIGREVPDYLSNSSADSELASFGNFTLSPDPEEVDDAERPFPGGLVSCEESKETIARQLTQIRLLYSEQQLLSEARLDLRERLEFVYTGFARAVRSILRQEMSQQQTKTNSIIQHSRTRRHSL